MIRIQPRRLLKRSGALLVESRFETSIEGMKNFSRSWIVGSTNQRISNITDHANTEQHKAAMTRYRIEQSKSACVPITQYILSNCS